MICEWFNPVIPPAIEWFGPGFVTSANLRKNSIAAIPVIIGPPGPDGLQGIKGDTGAAGADGLQGIKGDTGAAGADGLQGIKGDTGAAGADGLQGIKGDTGAAGADGLQGIKGDTGAAGADGLQGIKGDTGAAGADGLQGIKGDTGAAGADGLQGIKGDTGAAGADGLQGIKGDTGAAGADGHKGVVIIPKPGFFLTNLNPLLNSPAAASQVADRIRLTGMCFDRNITVNSLGFRLTVVTSFSFIGLIYRMTGPNELTLVAKSSPILCDTNAYKSVAFSYTFLANETYFIGAIGSGAVTMLGASQGTVSFGNASGAATVAGGIIAVVSKYIDPIPTVLQILENASSGSAPMVLMRIA